MRPGASEGEIERGTKFYGREHYVERTRENERGRKKKVVS
jgi:hypothetical protein